MRILQVLNQIYPFYTGGAEIFHYHLIKNLSLHGHDMAYLGYDDIDIVSIKFYKILKIKPLRVFVPLQTIYYLIKLRRSFDVVHLNYCQSNIVHWLYYPVLKKIFGLKYGLTIHDPREWRHSHLFKWVFYNADFVVAVSERLKNEYEKRCNREISYLPPVIPLSQAHEGREFLLHKLGFEKGQKIFLFAGSIKNLKRPLIIIEALQLLDRVFLRENKVVFLFIGDGDQLLELREKTTEYNLSSFVKIIGRVPNEEISKYYKIASFYIIPSMFEGKSMSLIEAMFNRLPIIASNVQGINDIIFDHENGLLFELDDMGMLSRKIMQIITDKELAERLAEQAYSDYSSQFRFDEIIIEYLKKYKE
jgi:glycosyltransferase involved in cell wall biosynthesis